jgi:C-terminal processing protease CtpA/Prc
MWPTLIPTEKMHFGAVLKIVKGEHVVESVVPESPADCAGIDEGCVLAHINNTNIRGLSEEEVRAFTTCFEGTKMVVHIRLPGEDKLCTRIVWFTKSKTGKTPRDIL